MTDKTNSRIPIRFVLGVLISMAALIALIWLADVEKVLVVLRQVSPLVLFPGLILVVISLFTRAYAWRGILEERISLWQSYLIVNAGYFVNTVLPFRLGEVSRALLLMPSGLGFWEALPSILLERMIDVGFALLLFFIGLPYALEFSNNLVYAYSLAGIVAVGVVALFLIVKNRERILHWLENSSWIKEGIRTRAIRFARSVFSSAEVLVYPRRLLIVLLGMGFSWAIALLFQFLLLRVFVPDARLVWAVFALGAVALGVAVPSSPGNIGLYEGSITLALSACGVDPSLALSYALVSHIMNLVVTTGFGAYGLIREGVGLRDVWQIRNQSIKGE